MSSKKNQEENDIKSIKYGIIYQNSPIIKISELFQFYIEKSKPNIIKKEENEYEFTLNDNKNLHYSFTVITEEAMKNLSTIYSNINFFLIFIDIQNKESLQNLEQYIDKLIACSETITKKSYIFGAYKKSNKIIYKDEKISAILNCKGVDYEYSEIDINLNEDFPKGVAYIIEDSKEIIEESKYEEMKDNLEKDKARSCVIF